MLARCVKLGVEAALVDGLLVEGDVEVDDGRIAALRARPPGAARIAVPGFVDLQVNGFGGVDFLDADADGYRRAGEALLETGVTAYLPTLITTPGAAAARRDGGGPDAIRRPAHPRHAPRGALPLANRLGTHEASARRDPDLALLDRLLDGGPVRLMTLAPELAGRRRADRPAARARRRRLARPQRRDRRAGQRGLRPRRAQRHASLQRDAAFLHRDPGIVGAALARDDVIVQLILDGVHLAPETA